MVADDTTHVSGKLTPEQIGEAIRHKKFGVDMRETIAQGFEYMLSWWELVQKLDKEFDNLSDEHKQDVKQLQSEITAFKEDYDKQVGLFQQALSTHWNAISKNKSDVNNLRVDFDDFLKRYDEDLQALRRELDAKLDDQDARLKKLEDAVFNAIYINDTDENATESNSGATGVDINDTHVVDDDNGIILEEDSPTLPRDVN